MGCGASSATGTLTGRAAVHEVVVDSAGVAHVSATTLDMERGDAKSADAESATAEPTALEGDSFEAPEEAHAMMEISAIVEADSQARLKRGAFSMIMFSAKKYDQQSFDAYLERAKKDGKITTDITMHYVETSLSHDTVRLALGFDGICVFVNDVVDADVIHWLRKYSKNTQLIALRCVGFNNVDLKAAAAAKLTVVRAAGYSPYSVAEHSVGLMLSLNRKIHKAYAKTRDLNFSLVGLTGFDVHGKTVGVIGAGRIGICVCNIYKGFGANVLYYNRSQKKDLDAQGCRKVELDELCTECDIISVHVMATPQTFHLLDKTKFAIMKPNVIIINAARGDIIHTNDLLDALDSKTIAGAGLDVFENEAGVCFSDISDTDGDLHPEIRQTLTRLLNHRRVIVTGHQAFLTNEALEDIASCTLGNVIEYMEKAESGTEIRDMKNQVPIELQEIEEALKRMARTKWKGAASAIKLNNMMGAV